MDKELLRKYVAIKPKGLNRYIWFKTENVSCESDVFLGQNGWGKNGALTNIKCNTNEIESYIYSDELQYNC
jgi:hypothetical protein